MFFGVNAEEQSASISARDKESVYHHEEEFNSRVDRTHKRISSQVMRTVKWFDGYFGSNDEYENYHNHSYLRLKTGIERAEGEGFGPRIRVSGKADLPILKEKLDVIASTASDELFRQDISGSESNYGQHRNGKLAAALRWTFLQTKRLNVHLDGGARFEFPIDPFIKAKLQYDYELPRDWQIRFKETLFATIHNSVGETTQIDIYKQLCEKTLLRFTSLATFSDDSDGFEWEQGIRFYQKFATEHAIQYFAEVTGVTDPTFSNQEYRIGCLYRKNFFRPWLYYVIEPEVSFPREHDWDSEAAIVFSLEYIFGENPKHLYNRFK